MDSLDLKPSTTSASWSGMLSVLADPALAPLFWQAERLGAPSAWWEHVPFAHWIVSVSAPRVLVELGTHTGVSYTAFCQAVVHNQFSTRCHAVDTWRGDHQSGEYGEEVYEDLRRFHDERFGTFSTLLRCTFDEALDQIENGTIDLLHIDGLHTYDAVRHDFESWLPKLSHRAVVLFHDTNVRSGDFGVWRLWSELSGRYPSFEFLHGHGLGVLAVGQQVPGTVAALCGLDETTTATVRARFARLGERWLCETRERLAVQDLGAHLDSASREADRLRADLAHSSAEAEVARATAARAEEAASEASARAACAEAALVAEQARAAQAASDLARVNRRSEEEQARRLRDAESQRDEAAQRLAIAQRDALAALERAEGAEAAAATASEHMARIEANLAQVMAERNQTIAERDRLLSSTAWRATWPVRSLGEWLPDGLRRTVRSGAELGWWTLTLKLPRKLRTRRAGVPSGDSSTAAAMRLLKETGEHRRREGNWLAQDSQLAQDAEAITASPHFDAQWYLRQYPDVAAANVHPAIHYLTTGAAEGRDPGPGFHTNWYLERNADVAKSGMNPLLHYVVFGESEGRCPAFAENSSGSGSSPLPPCAPARARPQPPALHTDLLQPRVLIIAELSIPQCRKYRVDQKQEMLRLLGVDSTVVAWQETQRALTLLQTHSVVIFYRVPAFPSVLSLIEEARRLSLPHYFEVDDLIFDIDSYVRNENLFRLEPDTVRGLLEGAGLYRRALEICHNVIASTEELGKRMQVLGGGSAHVIENALDPETLRIAAVAQRRPDDGKIRIIYGSGTRTHDADFAIASRALLRLSVRHPNVEIMLVGDITAPQELLNLGERLHQLPGCPYAEYLELLAKSDITIAPLCSGVFNDAKSNIKYLEAAAFGIPVVCSPRAAFAAAIRHGETGFLAETEDDWYASLDALVSDASLRLRLGEAARRYVLERYSLESIARRQLEPLLSSHRPRRDSRLHVLQVNVLYRPQSFGGATVLVEALASLLHVRPDTRVSVFTTAPAGWLAPYELERGSEDGVPVLRIGLQDRPGWSDEWCDERVAAAFQEVLRSLRPDIVHFHAIQGLGVGLLEACQQMGIPFAVTLHDAWWLCERQFLVTGAGQHCGQWRISLNTCASCVSNLGVTAFRTRRLRRALEKADLLLTPSEHWRRFHIANGFAPDRVQVNENGIDLPANPKPNQGPARLRFGFVAGAEAVKGFSVMKRAFESLERDDWDLVLVNHGLSIGVNSFEGLTWQARGTIRIVPPFAPSDKNAFFDSIDVLLFPSQWPESFGLTVREALVRNKWVIATDQGGAAEAITPGENGTLIPVGTDAAPLRAAVERLLDREPDLRSWANPCSGRIRDIETQAEELRRMLAEAAFRHSEARALGE